MTDDELTAIERRAEALPHYRISPGGEDACDCVLVPAQKFMDGDHLFGDFDDDTSEAEFYRFGVDAREDVPNLCNEIRRLRLALAAQAEPDPPSMVAEPGPGAEEEARIGTEEALRRYEAGEESENA